MIRSRHAKNVSLFSILLVSLIFLSGCVSGNGDDLKRAELDSATGIEITFPEPTSETLVAGESYEESGISIECVDVSIHGTSALLIVDGKSMILSKNNPIKVPFRNIILRLGYISVEDMSVTVYVYEF